MESELGMPDGSEVAEVMRELAVAAGAEILEIFTAGDPETSWKEDGTPVTVADNYADRVISAGLAKAFPGIPVVSEETPDSHSVRHRLFFIVDPLDGTSGFRSGKPEFTVNIALVCKGCAISGVVFAPALKRLFFTDGCGQLVERRNGHEIRHGRRAPASGPLRAVASRSRWSRDRLNHFLSDYDIAEVGFISSSIKFCLLAVDEADIYPRIGPTMEWDTAAGHAVLLAAGGQVLRLDGHDSLGYGKPAYRNPDFVALAPGVRLREM
ncbi:MAG: 3'(2'),5'-bisphosphate nucleotidase CysQ [Rhodobacteraceae bacterium]|nr:3'(2'),5'-bisphosphate nucleotidase CysQ [Paracoccaceae bacterium]